MPTLQLELNLWQQLTQAQQSPQAVDWQQLCLAFDRAMDDTPVGLKLATAADAISGMADVFAARADEFFSGWQRQRVAHEGPILDDDLFAEFVRQSFHLDLDGLVAEPELYVRSALEKEHGDDESVAEVVDKQELLNLLEPESQLEPTPMFELEHDEDVGAWAAIVRGWIVSVGVESVSIDEVVDATGLSPVKACIAGLLSDLELQQTKDFYSFDGLRISVK